jgi:hypothetical protein
MHQQYVRTGFRTAQRFLLLQDADASWATSFELTVDATGESGDEIVIPQVPTTAGIDRATFLSIENLMTTW